MLATILASVGTHGSSDELTAMDNIWLIISKPDNIPILMLIIAVGIYTYMAMRDARRNDKLIEQGRKKDILKSMQE